MNDLVHALMQARQRPKTISHQVPDYPTASAVPPGPFQMNPDLQRRLQEGLADQRMDDFDEKMKEVLRKRYGPLFEKANRCAELYGFDLDAIDRCMQEDEIPI